MSGVVYAKFWVSPQLPGERSHEQEHGAVAQPPWLPHAHAAHQEHQPVRRVRVGPKSQVSAAPRTLHDETRRPTRSRAKRKAACLAHKLARGPAPAIADVAAVAELAIKRVRSYNRHSKAAYNGSDTPYIAYIFDRRPREPDVYASPLWGGRYADVTVAQKNLRSSSWLCRTDDERARMLDLGLRPRPVQVAMICVLLLLAAIAVPSAGWYLLSVIAPSAAAFLVVKARASRYRRPEYLLAVVFLIAEVLLAAAILASDGRRSEMIVLLAIPTLLSGTAWPKRGALAAGAVTAVLMLALALLVDARAVLDTPPLAIYPLSILRRHPNHRRDSAKRRSRVEVDRGRRQADRSAQPVRAPLARCRACPSGCVHGRAGRGDPRRHRPLQGGKRQPRAQPAATPSSPVWLLVCATRSDRRSRSTAWRRGVRRPAPRRQRRGGRGDRRGAP